MEMYRNRVLSKIIHYVIFCYLAFGVSAAAWASKTSATEDRVLWVENADPAMAQAMRKARATLDNFLKLYKKPEEGMVGFKLKVHVSDMFGDEHFWVTPFEITKNGFSGILANDPQIVKRVAFGQKISFTRNDISDWGYMHNGKQYGSYTVCVLLNNMPEEQAEYFRQHYGFECE